MNLGAQLARSSITSLLNVITATIVALVLPPVLLSYITLEVYGVWALITVVNAYVALLDLGFQSSLVVLIANASAKKDDERILDLVNGAFWIYCGLFAVTSGLSYSLAPVLSAWLFSGDSQYAFALYAYTVVCLINLLGTPFSGLLRGFQRYDKANFCDIAALLINAGVTILLITHSWGLWAMIAGAAAGGITRCAGYRILGRGEFSKLAIDWRIGALKRVMPGLIRLSPSDQSIRLNSVITQTLIRVSINTFAGVAAVGAYDIGKRIVGQVGTMSAVIFAPLTPAATVLAARIEPDRVRELVDKSVFYLALVTLPTTCFVIFFVKPFLQLWLGNVDVSQISLVARLLMLGTMLELFTGPLTTIALGLSNVSLVLTKIAMSILLSVSLIPVLGNFFSFEGVLAGEFAAMVISSFVAMVIFYRRYGMPTLVRLGWVLKRTAMACSLASIATGVVWVTNSGLSAQPSLYALGTMVLVFAASTGIAYWHLGLISAAEIVQLWGLTRRGKSPQEKRR